jgi:hypothetical protein
MAGSLVALQPPFVATKQCRDVLIMNYYRGGRTNILLPIFLKNRVFTVFEKNR